MAEHPNFYESLAEASMRLRNAVIMYDGEPYYCLGVTNHKPNGIFRIYLTPTGQETDDGMVSAVGVTPDFNLGPNNGPGVGTAMDEWMEAKKGHKVIRKEMNSPLFNKFRPFPLGMINTKGSVFYVERHPTRRTEQGLKQDMLTSKVLTAGGEEPPKVKSYGRMNVDMLGKEFRATVLGEYPSAQECLDNLLNPKIVNEAAAFHRDFALVRGAVDMIFLAYKEDIVGSLPKDSLEEVVLGRRFRHVREAVSDLRLFKSIYQR